MTLIEFQDSVIYWLYNQEINSIIISCNVDINKKRNEIPLKKPSFTEMKNSLADQLSFKLSAVISAEISSTSDSLAVRIALTKSMSAILHCFSHKAVRAVLKNINLSDSANFISQSVKTISDSDSQAVRIILSTHRSHSWSWKDEIASIV